MQKLRKTGIKILAVALTLVMMLGMVPLGAVSAWTPTNLVRNGDFSIPITTPGNGWTLSNFGATSASTAANGMITEGPDAPSQRIRITNVGPAGEEWGIQLNQDVAYAAGATYHFTFTARSTVSRTISVQFTGGGGPSNANWLASTFNLTTEWQTFGPYVLPASAVNAPDQYVRFLLGGRTGFTGAQAHDIFIRNVSFININEVPPDPCDDCGNIVCMEVQPNAHS